MNRDNLNGFYEFLQSVPTVDSVRARLDQKAAQTHDGELNALLNDASKYIAELEKKTRNTLLEQVSIIEKLRLLDKVLQQESPMLGQIVRDAASHILELRRTIEEAK